MCTPKGLPINFLELGTVSPPPKYTEGSSLVLTDNGLALYPEATGSKEFKYVAPLTGAGAAVMEYKIESQSFHIVSVFKMSRYGRLFQLPDFSPVTIDIGGKDVVPHYNLNVNVSEEGQLAVDTKLMVTVPGSLTDQIHQLLPSSQQTLFTEKDMGKVERGEWVMLGVEYTCTTVGADAIHIFNFAVSNPHIFTSADGRELEAPASPFTTWADWPPDVLTSTGPFSITTLSMKCRTPAEMVVQSPDPLGSAVDLPLQDLLDLSTTLFGDINFVGEHNYFKIKEGSFPAELPIILDYPDGQSELLKAGIIYGLMKGEDGAEDPEGTHVLTDACQVPHCSYCTNTKVVDVQNALLVDVATHVQLVNRKCMKCNPGFVLHSQPTKSECRPCMTDNCLNPQLECSGYNDYIVFSRECRIFIYIYIYIYSIRQQMQ